MLYISSEFSAYAAWSTIPNFPKKKKRQRNIWGKNSLVTKQGKNKFNIFSSVKYHFPHCSSCANPLHPSALIPPTNLHRTPPPSVLATLQQIRGNLRNIPSCTCVLDASIHMLFNPSSLGTPARAPQPTRAHSYPSKLSSLARVPDQNTGAGWMWAVTWHYRSWKPAHPFTTMRELGRNSGIRVKDSQSPPTCKQALMN